MLIAFSQKIFYTKNGTILYIIPHRIMYEEQDTFEGYMFSRFESEYYEDGNLA
jgi:hypothetical protein